MFTPVQSVMTRNLITVPVGTSLKDAQAIMKEKRIRHLPVVGANKEIVGILSPRHIQSADLENTAVEACMSTSLEFVAQDVPLRQAILLMLQKQLDSLFIVDETTRAIGLVTKDDLLWHLAHLLKDENEQTPLLTARAQQTIGEVANELSMMGI